MELVHVFYKGPGSGGRNGSMKYSVIELRNYLLKPGMQAPFSRYFAKHFVDSQRALGGAVLGQYSIDDLEDHFFWIRGFKDMRARSRFLREFYEEGAVWNEFGTAANDMMIDSDNVHLLKPLDTGKLSLGRNQEGEIDDESGVVQIDYFYAKPDAVDDLVEFISDKYEPFLRRHGVEEVSFWASELEENDFPRLPVFQDENLVVAIKSFEDDRDYRSKTEALRKAGAAIEDELDTLIDVKRVLILHPAEKTVAGVMT